MQYNYTIKTPIFTTKRSSEGKSGKSSSVSGPAPESQSATHSDLVTPLFAVPFSSIDHPSPERLNEELRKLFLAREKAGKEFSNPAPLVIRNKALFESKFNLFDWPEPCVQELRRFCFDSLFKVLMETSTYEASVLRQLKMTCESWFHITRKGGYFSAHNHPLHSWSGVYCVQHDGDDPDSDSGKLMFLNPNAASTMYIDMGSARMKAPYTNGSKAFRLRPGQLVLFPSWLPHEVLPYEGDSERHTVAFNVRFKYAGK